jgi:hypothetical protein
MQVLNHVDVLAAQRSAHSQVVSTASVVLLCFREDPSQVICILMQCPHLMRNFCAQIFSGTAAVVALPVVTAALHWQRSNPQ